MQTAIITEAMTSVWVEYRCKSRSTAEDARKNKPNIMIKNGVRNRRPPAARYGALSIRPRLSTFVSVTKTKTASKNGQSQDAVPAARTAPEYIRTLIRLTQRLSRHAREPRKRVRRYVSSRMLDIVTLIAGSTKEMFEEPLRGIEEIPSDPVVLRFTVRDLSYGISV